MNRGMVKKLIKQLLSACHIVFDLEMIPSSSDSSKDIQYLSPPVQVSQPGGHSHRKGMRVGIDGKTPLFEAGRYRIDLLFWGDIPFGHLASGYN